MREVVDVLDRFEARRKRGRATLNLMRVG